MGTVATNRPFVRWTEVLDYVPSTGAALGRSTDRQVVRRLHPRRRDEPEIALPILQKPPRQFAAGPRRRHLLRPQVQHLGPRGPQPALKLRGRLLLAGVDYPEHPPKAPDQPLAL